MIFEWLSYTPVLDVRASVHCITGVQADGKLVVGQTLCSMPMSGNKYHLAHVT